MGVVRVVIVVGVVRVVIVVGVVGFVDVVRVVGVDGVVVIDRFRVVRICVVGLVVVRTVVVGCGVVFVVFIGVDIAVIVEGGSCFVVDRVVVCGGTYVVPDSVVFFSTTDDDSVEMAVGNIVVLVTLLTSVCVVNVASVVLAIIVGFVSGVWDGANVVEVFTAASVDTVVVLSSSSMNMTSSVESDKV